MIETQETLKRSRRDGRSVQTDFHEPDNHNGVVSHPEPDILECEVKWTLGSPALNKASGRTGIPVKLFKTLKDAAIKMLHSACQQIWKTRQRPEDQKRSIFIPIPKKGSTKNVQTIGQLHSSPMLVRSCLKILHVMLQHYANQELPDIQAGRRKSRGTRDQIVNILWIIEKAREFQKNIHLCFIAYAKAFDCVDHNKLWKALKEMGIPRLSYLSLQNPVYWSRSNSQHPVWNN